MRIVVELSNAQVKGIKQYLKEVSGVKNPTKKDVTQEVNCIVNGVLQSDREAVADYIKMYEL